MRKTLVHVLLVAGLVGIALNIVACCDRKSHDQSSKITAATVTPVTSPPAPSESYPATLAEGIDFTKHGYPAFIAEATGLSGYEPWGRWTEGAKATFRFTQPLPKRFTLIIQANAFGPNLGEVVTVKAGTVQQEFTITEQGQTRRLDFTLPEPIDTLELLIPKPTSPKDLQASEDARQLGLGLIKLQIQADDAQAVISPYRALITASANSIEIERGNFASLSLTVANQGSIPWNNMPPSPFALSYHLLDSSGAVLKYDNPRTAFPQPVLPDQQVTLALKADGNSFPGPGQYRLAFDVVHEGETWFAQKGSPILTLPVQITELQAPTVTPTSLREPSMSTLETAYPEFGQLWKLIQFTLSYAHEDFTLDNRHYQGFVAGGGYPQLWTRDSATVLHGARWFFAKPALSNWIELHLRRQGVDGNIRDWVNARGESDKNTVETDQESSLVSGAATYVRASGDRAWLGTEIDGVKILDRLKRALDSVWEHQRDADSGLLKGAHTIDWGDVELGGNPQDATSTDDKTIWTVDIYDQAMFVLSARDLAWLCQQSDEPQCTQQWQQRADEITQKTRAVLWQPDKGYFRMHRHLTPYTHPFNEDDMFAMGGNAVALEAGLATPDMAASIVRTTLDRQVAYHLPTIGGGPLPPYPDHYYEHPIVAKAYTYQNGGQWDWFAARLVLEMYRNGYSDAATRALRQIAQLDVKNGGIYEWEDKTGHPNASAWYSGAAGVLARALVEGYFGIDEHPDSLNITPRLKDQSGRIALYEPASGWRIAYDYRYQTQEPHLTLHLWSHDLGPCRFAITLPDALDKVETLTINGQVQPFEISSIGQDRQVIITLPHRSAEMVIEIR